MIFLIFFSIALLYFPVATLARVLLSFMDFSVVQFHFLGSIEVVFLIIFFLCVRILDDSVYNLTSALERLIPDAVVNEVLIAFYFL